MIADVLSNQSQYRAGCVYMVPPIASPQAVLQTELVLEPVIPLVDTFWHATDARVTKRGPISGCTTTMKVLYSFFIGK